MVKNITKRIVYKIGSSSLTNDDGSLREEMFLNVVDQLSKLHDSGHEIILVTSGSIAAGIKRMGFNKRPTKIAEKQACAAVGQGLLIEKYTELLMQHDIVSSQVLLTKADFENKISRENIEQTLDVLLSYKVIPIINENDTVSTDEIKVGDNDSLSSQVAVLVKADLLVLLTDVDGLYTENPSESNKAKHIDYVKEIDEDLVNMAHDTGSANGTGGMKTKLQAAQFATSFGVDVFVCASFDSDSLINALDQSNSGTFFRANFGSSRIL